MRGEWPGPTLLYLLSLSTGVVTDEEEPHRDDGPFRLPPIVIAIVLFNNGSKRLQHIDFHSLSFLFFTSFP